MSDDADVVAKPSQTDPLTDVLDTPDAGPLAIRGGAIRLVGYAVGVAISVVAAALLIRHLGAADYGRYLTVVSLITIVQGVSEAGLNNIGIREYAVRRGTDRDHFMESMVGMRIVFTLAGTIAATAFAAVAYDSTMVAGTALAGVGLLLLNLAGTYGVPLAAGLRLGLVTALDLVRQIGNSGLIVILVAADAGLLAFLAVPIPAHLLLVAATLVLVRGRMPVLPRFDASRWRSMLADTLPFAIATAAVIIYYRIAIIVMSLISSENETGYFGASFRIIEVLIAIPTLLVMSAFPILARAAKDDSARFQYALQRMTEVALILGAWTALSVALAAGFAIDVVAGDGFEPSVEALRIQSLVLIGTFLIATWGYGLLALRRHWALVGANGVALTLVTVLTLTLVPPLGADGAAIAMVATELTLATIYGFLLLGRGRDLNISFAAVPRLVVAIVLAGGIPLALGLPEAASLVIATVIYFATLLALGVIPREVRDALLARRS